MSDTLENPRFDEMALDGIVACLGDDAAALREENDDDERAKNMDDAADAIVLLRKQRTELRKQLEQAEARCKHYETALEKCFPILENMRAIIRSEEVERHDCIPPTRRR